MLRLQTQSPRAFLQLRLAFMRTPTPRKQNEQHLLLANGYCSAHAVSRTPLDTDFDVEVFSRHSTKQTVGDPGHTEQRPQGGE